MWDVGLQVLRKVHSRKDLFRLGFEGGGIVTKRFYCRYVYTHIHAHAHTLSCTLETKKGREKQRLLRTGASQELLNLVKQFLTTLLENDIPPEEPDSVGQADQFQHAR